MFTYVENVAELVSSDSDYVAIVPQGITDHDQLMESLYGVLDLPGYFGFNWNALYDCLCDFHWIDQKRIIIVHKEVPQLSDVDMSEYLDVLHSASHDWKPGEEHQLDVVFPEKDKDAIMRVLKSKQRGGR